MKIPYTTLQLVLIVLSAVLGLACLTGNAGIVILDDNAVGKWIFRLNLLLCVIFSILFTILIRHPEKTRVFNDQSENRGDPVPVLSATRTYLCFIALDVAAVFSFVLVGGQMFRNPALAVILISAGIFFAAVGKYLYDIGRIGIAEPEAPKAEPDTLAAEEVGIIPAQSPEYPDEIERNRAERTEGNDYIF